MQTEKLRKAFQKTMEFHMYDLVAMKQANEKLIKSFYKQLSNPLIPTEFNEGLMEGNIMAYIHTNQNIKKLIDRNLERM